MHILFAADGWHDEAPGGANRMPTDFARYLAGRGYDVIYVCASAEVERTTTSIRDGVQLHRYPRPRRRSPSVMNAWAHVHEPYRVAREADRIRGVAVVLGHNQLQYLGASAGCGRHTRRCYTVYSPFVDEQREGITGPPTIGRRLAWRGAAAIERRILSVSDTVQFMSAFARTRTEYWHPGLVGARAALLPGWVDAGRFRPAAGAKAALRDRLGAAWQGDAPVFFSLRRLVPRMGLDTLIDAAALLAREGRDFRIVIGGDGSERTALEARARAAGVSGRIAFLGRIPDDRLPDCYAAADCFVLPTRALECFGLIILESYACGVPVIAVPVGAIPETMGAANAAWLTADNTAAAIADRLRDFLDGRLAADPAGLRTQAEAFDMPVVAGQYEDRLVRAVVEMGAERTQVRAGLAERDARG